MGALTPIANTGLNLLASSQANKQAAAQDAKDRKRRIQELGVEDSRRRQKEKQDLSAKIATQRSRAGANGTSLTGGSIDAILRNLQNNAESEALANSLRSQSKLRSIKNSGQKSGIDLLNFSNILKDGFR